MDLCWPLQMNKEINKDLLEIWIPSFQNLCNLLCIGKCIVTTYQWAGFYIMTWLGWGELGSDVGPAKIFVLRNSEAGFEIDHPLACRKYHFKNAVLQHKINQTKSDFIPIWWHHFKYQGFIHSNSTRQKWKNHNLTNKFLCNGLAMGKKLCLKI